MENEVVAPAAPAPVGSPEQVSPPSTEVGKEPVKETVSAPLNRRDAIKAAMDKPKAEVRDDKGKFAKKDEPAKVAATPKVRKYPSSFKPDYQPVYEELSTNEKYQGFLDEIERREGDYHKGIEPYKESAAFAQSIRNAMAPYEANIRARNLTPDKAVDALLRADHNLRTLPPVQRQEYLLNIARQYGIEMPAAEQQAQPQIDPYVQALWQRQQQQEQVLNQYLTAKQHEDNANAVSQIATFKKDHEFMDDELGFKMGDLIDKGLAKGLDDAYDMVIWSTPAIRAKVLAKQQSESEAKRKEAAQASVSAAKAAGVQIKGAPSSGNGANRPVSGKNRRELIASMIDRSA